MRIYLVIILQLLTGLLLIILYKKIQKGIKETKMGQADILAKVSELETTLEDVDQKTTEAGDRVTTLSNAYEGLKTQLANGADTSEVVAALENLNAKLKGEGDKIANIYSTQTNPTNESSETGSTSEESTTSVNETQATDPTTED